MGEFGLLKLGMTESLLTDPFKSGLIMLGTRLHVINDKPESLFEMLQNKEIDIALLPPAALFKNHKFLIIPKIGIITTEGSGVFKLCSKRMPDQIEKVLVDERAVFDIDFLNLMIPRLLMLHPGIYISKERITSGFDFAKSDYDAFLLLDEDAYRCPYGFMMTWNLDDAWKNYTNMPFVRYVFLVRPDINLNQFDDILLKTAFSVKKNFQRDAYNAAKKFSLNEHDVNSLYQHRLTYFLDPRCVSSIKMFTKEMSVAGLIKGQIPMKFYNTRD